jgi:oligopeptide transport system ATP-binding protein
MSEVALLAIRSLSTEFHTDEGTVKAVNGVSLDLERGRTLGIVGESGSGKSVTSLSVMRLIPDPPGRITGGRVEFNGRDLLSLSDDDMRRVRGRRIAMVFQDPMTSLNPFMRVVDQLTEVTRLHLGHTSKQALDHAIRMLELVGIPDAQTRIRSYPHEFSGGMRQRVMIAGALSCQPELLIADEPTTALDVTTQAQILDLIRRLQRDSGTSVVLITHDLGVVAGMADEVIVMYAGMVFERAAAGDLFARPGNPYTRGLLRSVPSPSTANRRLFQIPGNPPDMTRLPPGCPFSPRCDRVQEICRNEPPPFVQLAAGHHSLCHFATDVYGEARTHG